MSKLGGWNIKMSTSMPQKIASAVAGIDEICGCKYQPVLYIGSQEVDGTNHAVLMKQIVTNGRDSVNAAVVVFNEKPSCMDVSVIDIHRIVESGGVFGGTTVDITTDIPFEAMEAYKKAREAYIGAGIKPKAFLGTKIVKGKQYILFGEVESMASPDAKTDAAMIVVNDMTNRLRLEPVFEPGDDDSLGYAFSW